MRVLVTGGHDLDPAKVCGWLCENVAALIGAEPTFVIHGDSPGADKGALNWHKIRAIAGRMYCVNWKRYGSAAGSICNNEMLRDGKPDVVIAFASGIDAGDMMERARTAGVRVIEAAGDFARAEARP